MSLPSIDEQRRWVDLKWAIRTVEQHGLAPLARIAGARPRTYGAAYSQWNRQRQESEAQITANLRERGVAISLSGAVRVRFAGISAGSTMGLQQALKHWKAAARKRLEGAGK